MAHALHAQTLTVDRKASLPLADAQGSRQTLPSVQ